MDAMTGTATHLGVGEGDAVWAMGGLFEMKLDVPQTGGVIAVAEVTQPVGVATPLHVHRHEAECFYLLSGSMIYEAGGERFELSAGSLMWLPRGVPHRFRITGTEPARFLAIVVPGDLLNLYREVGTQAAERAIPEHPDPAEFSRWAEVGPRYGLEVLGGPLPA